MTGHSATWCACRACRFADTHPPIPRPLPPRSAWTLSPPVPTHGPETDDRMRRIAAANPGCAVGRHTAETPARPAVRPAAGPTGTAEGSTVDTPDPGPEIAPEAPALLPGGLIRPPLPYRLIDPAPLEIPPGNPGADLAQLVRTALAKPPTGRWRWWRRTWTRWRDRKRED